MAGRAHGPDPPGRPRGRSVEGARRPSGRPVGRRGAPEGRGAYVSTAVVFSPAQSPSSVLPTRKIVTFVRPTRHTFAPERYFWTASWSLRYFSTAAFSSSPCQSCVAVGSFKKSSTDCSSTGVVGGLRARRRTSSRVGSPFAPFQVKTANGASVSLWYVRPLLAAFRAATAAAVDTAPSCPASAPGRACA